MQKIGDITDTADGNGEFTDGSVSGNVQPTELMAAWFTTMQREVIAVLTEAGIQPDKANDAQLLAAIKFILAKGIEGSGYLVSKNNLSDLADIAISRGHLGLGSAATSNSQDFVSSSRKVNNKQLNADITLNANDVGAISKDGGAVDHLDNARYYNSRQGEWQGGGAFANQYADPTAPFCIPGFTVPKDTSMYLPIVKGLSQTDFYGYVSAVSFGALRSGQGDFGSAVIHIIGDSGASTMFNFQSKDGSFSAPGSINAGGAILAVNGDISGTLWGGFLSTWLNTQFASAKNLAQDAWNKANDAQNNSVRDSRRGPQQYINPGENGIWNGFEIPNGYFSGTRNHTDDGNAKFNEYYYRVQQIYIASRGWVDTGTA